MKNRLPLTFTETVLGIDITVRQILKYHYKITETPGGCWEWQGSVNSMGYGTLRLNKVYLLAHRVFFALHKQEPGSLDVCHVCDNPLCCNPSHLFLGTRKDNMLDMVSKGRHWKKLTSDQIETIRKLRAEGKTIKEIAELTEFSKTAINKYMRTKSEKEEE